MSENKGAARLAAQMMQAWRGETTTLPTAMPTTPPTHASLTADAIAKAAVAAYRNEKPTAMPTHAEISNEVMRAAFTAPPAKAQPSTFTAELIAKKMLQSAEAVQGASAWARLLPLVTNRKKRSITDPPDLQTQKAGFDDGDLVKKLVALATKPVPTDHELKARALLAKL